MRSLPHFRGRQSQRPRGGEDAQGVRPLAPPDDADAPGRDPGPSDQLQLVAAYDAVTFAETALPSIVAVAATLAVPADRVARRVENVDETLFPAAIAISLDPLVVVIAAWTGTPVGLATVT